jgi:hypothetical protein
MCIAPLSQYFYISVSEKQKKYIYIYIYMYELVFLSMCHNNIN